MVENAQIAERLKTLRAEHEAGQRMLADLEQKRQSLQATLLRIEGAIQILRELHEAVVPDPDPIIGPPDEPKA